MPNITTCRYCGTLYEAGSEESANEPGRLCRECARIEPSPVDSLGNITGPARGEGE